MAQRGLGLVGQSALLGIKQGRGDEEHEALVVVRARFAFEQVANDGDSAEEGHARGATFLLRFIQATHGDGVAVVDLGRGGINPRSGDGVLVTSDDLFTEDRGNGNRDIEQDFVAVHLLGEHVDDGADGQVTDGLR